MTDQNATDETLQTPHIALSREEVDWITGKLVKLPYENVAPVIQLLGQKLLALMAEADKK